MNLKTFCMNKKISYEEILLKDSIINKVYEIYNPSKKEIIGVPDGCVDIQAFWKDNKIYAYVCGSFQKAAVSTTGSYEKCIGVKFNPGIMMECFKGSMGEIIDNKIDLGCFFSNAPEFCELAAEEESLQEKVPKIQHFFENEKICEQHMIVEYLFNMMLYRQMDITIAGLTEELCYSQRQVERIFKEHTGFTIKKYESILRMQQALHLIKRGSMSQDMILENLGYYDQAHFIHEFKRYTMQTPGKFMKNENKIVIV